MSSITLRHKAHEEIKKKIIFFEIMPGEKLSDKQIAAELGLGRTPVREALLVLEREGLVQCSGKQGYFVRKLSSKEVDGYLALRASLETFAIPLILQNATHDVLKELRDNIAKSEECARQGKIQDMMVHHAEFHRIIYRATESEVFIDVMSGLNDKFHWLRAIALKASKGSPGQALEGHRRIVEAMETRNPKQLKKAFQVHLRHTFEQYVRLSSLFS